MNTSNYSVVIPLIASRNNDVEIRYCLRSIEKHLPHKNIIIIGHKPDFLQNIVHIPFMEFRNKQFCIRTKILTACRDERVTDSFIFTNDDIFILKPVDELPFYYFGDLTTPFERGVSFLYNALTAQGYPVKNFDTHVPIVYEKQKFKEAAGEFGGEFIIKSAYCNYHRIEGTEFNDVKIHDQLPIAELRSLIDGSQFFSIGDFAFNDDMLLLLNELFPEKCKYEI